MKFIETALSLLTLTSSKRLSTNHVQLPDYESFPVNFFSRLTLKLRNATQVFPQTTRKACNNESFPPQLIIPIIYAKLYIRAIS